MSKLKKECECKKSSCPEGCSKNHTHKVFFCEKCEPETYKKVYPFGEDFEEEIHMINKPVIKCKFCNWNMEVKNPECGHIPIPNEKKCESINYVQVGKEFHCLFCHETLEGEHLEHSLSHIQLKENTTLCFSKCGKWFNPITNKPKNCQGCKDAMIVSDGSRLICGRCKLLYTYNQPLQSEEFITNKPWREKFDEKFVEYLEGRKQIARNKDWYNGNTDEWQKENEVDEIKEFIEKVELQAQQSTLERLIEKCRELKKEIIGNPKDQKEVGLNVINSCYNSALSDVENILKALGK